MILKFIDLFLFILLGLNVLYIFVFCIGAILRSGNIKKPPVAKRKRKIACLIPAYKEDSVIEESVDSCLDQDYPQEWYDVIVISDQMQTDTNNRLIQKGIILNVVEFENSTKAKALNKAMLELGDNYDIAVILDADNTIPKQFFSEINNAFDQEQFMIYQAHRTAKNQNTHLAYLDAMSEEINNTVFRLGHVALNLSSALIGSGMAFQYSLLKRELAKIDAVGGFDRALELTLIKDGYRIGYLQDLYVYDEKVQTQKNFSNQRRRWMSAQLHYLRRFMPEYSKELFRGNWDFCDKIGQHLLIPRLILLGILFLTSVMTTIFFTAWSLKWWILLAILTLLFMLATPRKLYSWKLLLAGLHLPLTFLNMFVNLFKLRNANKKFIHTEHGIKK